MLRFLLRPQPFFPLHRAYSTAAKGGEPPIFNDIRKLITDNKAVLFMKGTPDRPQCGFSATVIRILDIEGVDRDDYVGVDILEDDEMRQGIKDFTDWPTIPQLYVEGEFIGGCDIVRDMHVAKELTPILAKAGLVKTAESK